MNKLQILPEETLSLQVQEPIVRTGAPVIHPKRITENGQYSAKAEGASGFDPVEVAVDLKPAFDTGYTTGYKIGAKDGAEVGYAKGKNDAEANAIALVNEGIAGCDLGIEEADSIEQIPEKIDEVCLASQEQGFQAGMSAGYDNGKVDGAQNALDAVNGELIPRGLEGADSVGEIPDRLDDAFITLESNGYESGYNKGYEDGVAEGGTEDLNAVLTEQETLIATLQDTLRGKASGGGDNHYDAFWDAYQQNGNRTDYNMAFGGAGWTDETFKPKYPIAPVGKAATENTFYAAEITNIPDGVLDFSQVTYCYMTFRLSKLITSPPLDLSNCTEGGAHWLFSQCPNLKEIKTLTVSEGVTYTNFVLQCAALEKITFAGTIGQSLSFVGSPLLANESVQSIIDHLKDLTGATAQTLTFHATVGGKLTQAQKDAISAKNWTLVY